MAVRSLYNFWIFKFAKQKEGVVGPTKGRGRRGKDAKRPTVGTVGALTVGFPTDSPS